MTKTYSEIKVKKTPNKPFPNYKYIYAFPNKFHISSSWKCRISGTSKDNQIRDPAMSFTALNSEKYLTTYLCRYILNVVFAIAQDLIKFASSTIMSFKESSEILIFLFQINTPIITIWTTEFDTERRNWNSPKGIHISDNLTSEKKEKNESSSLSIYWKIGLKCLIRGGESCSRQTSLRHPSSYFLLTNSGKFHSEYYLLWVSFLSRWLHREKHKQLRHDKRCAPQTSGSQTSCWMLWYTYVHYCWILSHIDTQISLKCIAQ